MLKIPRQEYTTEFRMLAVQRVKDGQNIRDVARELGISHQTLRNWVKSQEAGTLKARGQSHHAGADGIVASACREQAADDGAGDHKKSCGVLHEGTAVKYA